ncbi:LptA/OstA family protein [Steroidobacter cummioxidans]|uniref:LptA/OstA family protein n=1 Tax=Steroidobacter cummioxidans TaxID=1803913 RepID=UPI000E3141AC|nr:LptA/OstA family protein [Steroidobacter cummioxidans]
MADLIRNRGSKRHAKGALGAVLLLLATVAGGAANMPKLDTLDGGLAYSADVVSSDFRHDTLELSGNVRAEQGPMSIEAQTAKARNFRAPNSHWTFEQAVRIRSAEADLQSNVATADFLNGELSDVRIQGSPARFEQIGAANNRQVRGRAGVIEYDINSGVVKLTDQVWFSNGKDEFRGDVVIYNVRDERVQINPGGSSNRVRGIIRPNQDKSQTSGGGTGGTAAIVEPTFNENGEKIGDERVEPKLATDNHGGGA